MHCSMLISRVKTRSKSRHGLKRHMGARCFPSILGINLSFYVFSWPSSTRFFLTFEAPRIL